MKLPACKETSFLLWRPWNLFRVELVVYMRHHHWTKHEIQLLSGIILCVWNKHSWMMHIHLHHLILTYSCGPISRLHRSCIITQNNSSENFMEPSLTKFLLGISYLHVSDIQSIGARKLLVSHTSLPHNENPENLSGIKRRRYLAAKPLFVPSSNASMTIVLYQIDWLSWSS